jgi:hypothetical protein
LVTDLKDKEKLAKHGTPAAQKFMKCKKVSFQFLPGLFLSAGKSLSIMTG